MSAHHIDKQRNMASTYLPYPSIHPSRKLTTMVPPMRTPDLNVRGAPKQHAHQHPNTHTPKQSLPKASLCALCGFSVCNVVVRWQGVMRVLRICWEVGANGQGALRGRTALLVGLGGEHGGARLVRRGRDVGRWRFAIFDDDHGAPVTVPTVTQQVTK